MPSSDQAYCNEHTGNIDNEKDIRFWKKLYEIEAPELTEFKSKNITNTLFGDLSDDWLDETKLNDLKRKSLYDIGF